MRELYRGPCAAEYAVCSPHRKERQRDGGSTDKRQRYPVVLVAIRRSGNGCPVRHGCPVSEKIAEDEHVMVPDDEVLAIEELGGRRLHRIETVTL